MEAITPSELSTALLRRGKAGLATMVWGSSGCGKSQIIQQFAEEIGAKFYDLRCNLYDPVDVRGGLKVERQHDGSYRTRYGIPEDYPDPNSKETHVLDLEELNTAPKATMNAFLQLVLDKRVGNYKLPENTIIVGACNRAKDRAAVHQIPTPLKARFNHVLLEPDLDDLCSYFRSIYVDPSIIGFLRYRPNLVSNFDYSKEANPCPRTWEMLSNMLPFINWQDHNEPRIDVSACIGEGAASEFISYRAIYQDLPDIDGIIKSPTSGTVPEKPSLKYAIITALATRTNATNLRSIIKYIRRLDPEFQAAYMKDIAAMDNTLINTPEYDQWINDHASVLL